jgi:3-carboxy-cis,cis-muconate cycloisomerase
MMLLAPKLGRDGAHKLVEAATKTSVANSRPLAEVLAEMSEVSQHLDPATIRDLDDPEKYLGCAEIFRQRLLNASKNRNSPAKE